MEFLYNILQIIGASVVTACATIFGLYLQRKWKRQDAREENEESVSKKIDELTRKVNDISVKLDNHIKSDSTAAIESEEKATCLQSGLREILYERIKCLAIRYEAAGEIREEEYNSLNRMWSVYHNELGGNGYLDDHMKAVDGLNKI